jgi:regulator of sigma E protease
MESTMPFELIAALDWTTFLWWVDVIFKVSVGLGAVIFVHELGHFLVAKACGVKCEKFMIGFDIGGYKISRRWGETEYGIGILPLGGYVKMLGQDDDPARIAEQMQKSQVDAESANAVPVTGPSGETYYVDRRSYLAKSVPQRMAIISAGVIMNVIFAFIFAVVAYGMGVPYQPCIVSETVPGSPAWRERIEPGDEIVRLGDRENPTFVQLMGGVTLGDRENGIPCVVRRAEDDRVVRLTLKPAQEPGKLAMIGVRGPQSLRLSKYISELEGSAVADAKLVSPSAEELTLGKPEFQAGDHVVRVGDVPVSNYREFSAQLVQHADKPLQVTVDRPAKGQGAGSEEQGAAQVVRESSDPAENDAASTTTATGLSQELTFEVPAQRLRDFGLSMKMGPIVAIQEDSPADAAGFVVGDVIEMVDGRPAGADEQDNVTWTPDRLPDLLREAAIAGREVEFIVSRSRKSAEGTDEVTLRVTPRIPEMYYSTIPPGAPQGSEAIGIAYRVENEIQAVLPNGPAADAELAPGDTITAARLIYPKDKDGKSIDSETIELGPQSLNWPFLVSAVQLAPKETVVEFTVKKTDSADAIQALVKVISMEDRFVAVRGFSFEPIEQIRTANSFAEQVRFGAGETVDALTMVFRFLQKLGTQVPITMLGGPGTIAMAAGGAASQGVSTLLIFLTMLSANLAVINFLPIPLLDGGHMMFLAYEGLRGRPANEKVVVALHMAGFAFIITLMLFVIGLDIQRWLIT